MRRFSLVLLALISTGFSGAIAEETSHPRQSGAVITEPAAGREAESGQMRERAFFAAAARANRTTRNGLWTAVYPVAELVEDYEAAAGSNVEAAFQLDRLTAFLQRGTDAKYWGDGTSVTPHAGTLSLVVRNRSEGHRQLAEFLTQLRAAQSGWTELTVSRVPPSQAASGKSVLLLTDEEADAIKATRAATTADVRMTLRNSPYPMAELPGGLRVSAVPTFDGESALIQLHLPASGDLGASRHPLKVAVGQSFLVRSTVTNGDDWLLVTVDRIGTGVDEETP